VVIGRWVDRELEFFGNVRARLAATSVAAAIAVAAVGLLTWLGNGSIGVERLASVGPSVAPVVGALLIEVLAGGLGWAGWRAWREDAAARAASAAEGRRARPGRA
jgi:protein-S-isoprenylcysteine O-methyltransferase Ste14